MLPWSPWPEFVSERVLSTRALNRALLARQLLLERSTLPLPRALERVAGLQTQYAPSAYIALWSRLHRFRREALTRALEQRRVVQATLMRVTIHMVSAGDFPLFAAAIRKGRRGWWLRVHADQLRSIDMTAVAAQVRALLRSGPPPERSRRSPAGGRLSTARLHGRGDVAGPGACSSLRQLGAAARGSVRPGRRLAQTVEAAALAIWSAAILAASDLLR